MADMSPYIMAKRWGQVYDAIPQKILRQVLVEQDYRFIFAFCDKALRALESVNDA